MKLVARGKSDAANIEHRNVVQTTNCSARFRFSASNIHSPICSPNNIVKTGFAVGLTKHMDATLSECRSANASDTTAPSEYEIT